MFATVVAEGKLRVITRFACVLAALLGLSSPSAAFAEPSLPAFTLDRFDKPVSEAVDSKGLDTIVIYGDELDLANTLVSAIRPPGQRAHDFVLVARTIKLGPKTEFYMNGQVAAESFEKLRGGDLYLIADSIVLNGDTTGGTAGAPIVVRREGGYHSANDINPDRSRSGRIFVLANKVALADEFIRARVSALNVAEHATTPVPSVILKVISRTFSSTNSIQQAVANNTRIFWGSLGDAYRGWLAEETPAALSVRELNLSLVSTHALDNSDVVGSFNDAVRYVPVQILAPWYLTYLKRNAAVAQAALIRLDYDMALDAIRKAKLFTASAPTSVLASTEFANAVTSLKASEMALTKENIFESLSFPVEGGPPIEVLVVRDLGAGRVAVVPHQVLLNSVLDNGVFRLGFMMQEGQNVRLRMRGRMVADPSILELVRAKFPKSEIRVVEGEVTYDTLNLGLVDALVSGSARVVGAGVVDFDLLLQGKQFLPTLLRLSQPFGIDTTVNIRHQQLELGSRTTRVNLALGRTETTLLARDGVLSNPFPHSLDIDYVLDDGRPITKGLPVQLASGDNFKPGCQTPLCYAPGSAVRRKLAASEVNTWFVSVPNASAVQQYLVENQLESDAARGGSFRALVLNVTFTASPGASPQRVETFTLGPRGAFNSKRTLSFVAPTNGGGKLEISGRAYWGNGQSYYDIPTKVVESTVTIIDAAWLK